MPFHPWGTGSTGARCVQGGFNDSDDCLSDVSGTLGTQACVTQTTVFSFAFEGTENDPPTTGLTFSFETQVTCETDGGGSASYDDGMGNESSCAPSSAFQFSSPGTWVQVTLSPTWNEAAGKWEATQEYTASGSCVQSGGSPVSASVQVCINCSGPDEGSG